MKLKTTKMRILFIFLLGLITFQVSAQKIIQAGSFATQSALTDTAEAIRLDLLVDTTITVENVTYSIEDSIDLSRFRKIVFVLSANSSSATLRVPEASLDFKSTTIYVMALNSPGGSCGLAFTGNDLNAFQLVSTITELETGIYSVSDNAMGGYMWIETKSANIDNDGIISALPLGDVDIDGAASSDLRIRDTRIQFDARMKIGSDSSFIHDPAQDTTVIKGDIVLGKFCTNNTYPFSMRNAANSSTNLLIESGASTGYAGLKLLSYNLPSQIEFGGTTSKYLNFYNANNTRNVLSVGTNTNARTVLVGNVEPGVNGAFIVNDTISSGKGLGYLRKISSNSTPILTLTSVSNDRFVFHDDGRVFFNNLGTGTATQTLGITSSGQVVPYTQVYPTAHVSAIDAAVDISTQVNSSITTYVSYYLTSGTSRTLTLPEPSSALAGRSVIVSYTATDFGYTGVVLNTASATSEFWAMSPTTLAGTAFTFSSINAGRQSVGTWTCRQINGTWYWAEDNFYDPSATFTSDERVTGVTGTTLTFTESVELGIFNDIRFSLYKNGLFLSPGVDYTVASTEPVTITLAVAAISGDVFFFQYK